MTGSKVQDRFDEARNALIAEGFRSPTLHAEQRWLYIAARSVSSERERALIVELGTDMALTSMLLGQAVMDSARPGSPSVVSVDNHDRWLYDQNVVNVKKHGYGDVVSLVHADMMHVLGRFQDGSISMCIHDASHNYGDVLAALRAYFPKMAPAAIICGHDYWPVTSDGRQVVRAVDDWREESSHVIFGFGTQDRLWWTLKGVPQ